MINIQLERIEDPVVRESFQKLLDEFRSNPFLNNTWRVYEWEFSAADSQAEVPHNLPFIPENAVLLFIEGDMNFYFRYDLFDRTNIVCSVGGPCRVRFVAGRNL